MSSAAFGERSRTETDGEVAGEGRLTKRLGTFNQLSTTGRPLRSQHRRVALDAKGVARIRPHIALGGRCRHHYCESKVLTLAFAWRRGRHSTRRRSAAWHWSEARV
jgi:hypothetical protein